MDRTKAIIRKVGDKFCVFSHDGQNLGCSTSHDGAVNRLREVEYFKHNKGSSHMSYDHLFNNLAKAIKSDTDPKQIGQHDGSPREVSITSDHVLGDPKNLEDSLRSGTLAGRLSSKLLDTKDHFPVFTQTQAQSSMARVLQLSEVPAWYNGTIADLRNDVYNGILVQHPEIQLNVRVPAELAVALSDGQTPAETSQTEVKDPNDVQKTLVPGVARPTLTTAQVVVALSDENTRATVAGNLLEMVDKQLLSIKNVKKVAEGLMKNGLEAAEFDKLSTYVQQSILGEILSINSTASASVEDRRRELLDKMKKNQDNARNTDDGSSKEKDK